MDRADDQEPPGAEKVGELSALRELVEWAPCGYLTCGDDGVITWVNQTFLRWTGHRRDALVGIKLTDLLPVGERVLWATSCVPQLRTTGSVAEVVLEVLTAEGSRRAVLISATRYDAGGGGAPQVKVVVFGVHERAQQQRSLIDTLHRARESEQRRTSAEAQVRRLKAHDPLTGLRNRRGFIDVLETALREGPRAPMAVMVVDVDHFKTVNDSLGYATGDELLSVVARRLAAIVGAEGGRLARLAGDEFAVMAQVFGGDDCAALARCLLDAVGEPTTVDGLEIVVSAGIGVARFAPGESAEQVMRRAGAAVYRAKAHGPNTVRVHDLDAMDPAAHRLKTLGELRRGIDRGELLVHYTAHRDGATVRFSSTARGSPRGWLLRSSSPLGRPPMTSSGTGTSVLICAPHLEDAAAIIRSHQEQIPGLARHLLDHGGAGRRHLSVLLGPPQAVAARVRQVSARDGS